MYLLWHCTYSVCASECISCISQDRFLILCHVMLKVQYIDGCSQCDLPFNLDIQRVCGASVWVALSSLFWAQQRPAVILHDTTDFQLDPLNSHHLTGRKYVIKSNQSQGNHKNIISTDVYCNHVAHIKANFFTNLSVFFYLPGSQWFPLTSACCENRGIWELGNP